MPGVAAEDLQIPRILQQGHRAQLEACKERKRKPRQRKR